MLRVVNLRFIRNMEPFCQRGYLFNLSSTRLNSTNSNPNTNVVDPQQEQKSPVNAEAEHNQVPQTTTKLNGLYKYLVYKFSSQKYKSINDVPDELPVSQVNYAKDKGRAVATVYLIGATVLGSIIAIYLGKRDHKRGIKYTDGIMKQHAEYSKTHQEMLKSSNK